MKVLDPIKFIGVILYCILSYFMRHIEKVQVHLVAKRSWRSQQTKQEKTNCKSILIYTCLKSTIWI